VGKFFAENLISLLDTLKNLADLLR